MSHGSESHAGHGHGLPAGPGADELLSISGRSRRRVIRWIAAILISLTLLTIIGTTLLWPSGSYRDMTLDDPYGTAEGFAVVTSTVVDVRDVECPDKAHQLDATATTDIPLRDAESSTCQQAIVDPDGGGNQRIKVDIPPEITASDPITTGDRVKTIQFDDLPGIDAIDEGVFIDFQRTIPVALLAALYVLVVVLVARWRGLRAILGLGLSFAVIFWFMIPALLEGKPPMWVGLVGSCLIMVAVLYFAHGFSLRTTTALLGTLAGLALTAILAAWGTNAAYLIGLGEEYSYVLNAVAPEVRLSGIVLCGLLIAGLGVLNDVTITQSSAVWELQAADPHMSAKELFSAGMRIGRDHIASTVYTIAFAYAGAALTTLMVVSLYDRSILDTMLSAEMVEEVVRILIGSIGLVLAIPITTGIAVAVAKSIAR